MRPVIPLSAIRIFEAAARRRSFKAAAEDLGLSTSAISHAVRKIEEGLGVALFERTGQGVALTSAGETLFDHVGRAFEVLDRGARSRDEPGLATAAVALCPEFCRSMADAAPCPLPA